MFIILCACLFSCASNEQVHEEPIVKVPEPDTITPLLESINAREKKEQLNAYFTALNKRGFNGNVLIAQQGLVIYDKAFGFKNRKTKDSLTINTNFQLASVSKQFTAVAIMMLKEKGLLNYTDSIEKFILGFPYKGITVHDLLCHRSGLPNYMYFCDALCSDKFTPLSNFDVVDLMLNYRPWEYFRPGKRFNYSNTNYCVLAAIIEKLSGSSFNEYITQNIFKPLGMTNSVVYSAVDSTYIPEEAIGHYYTGKPIEKNYLNGVVGDKGIYSSVHDLFKWEQALYTEKLLSRETLAEAFLPKNKTRKNSNYGYGWRMFNLDDGTRVLFHGGWWQGFRNSLIRIEKDKTSIIVLSNVENRSFTIYNLPDILKILYPSADNKNVIEEE